MEEGEKEREIKQNLKLHIESLFMRQIETKQFPIYIDMYG